MQKSGDSEKEETRLDGAIIWFVDKEHWLIVMGIVLAVLGAIYNAYGLDQERKFFGGLTQGLSFGLVGGLLVSLGLGLVGLSYVVMTSILYSFEYGLQTGIIYVFYLGFTITVRIITEFLLTGLVLGIIFGFLTGYRLNKVKFTVLFLNTFNPAAIMIWYSPIKR